MPTREDFLLFEDTPEYQEMKEAFRRDLVEIVEASAQRIKEAPALADLHDIPDELQKQVRNLSYNFFVIELPRKVIKWVRERNPKKEE